MEFLTDGRSIINPLRLNYKTQNMMELNTVLYYVGKPRRDARVIELTSKNLSDNEEVIQQLIKLKRHVLNTKKSSFG